MGIIATQCIADAPPGATARAVVTGRSQSAICSFDPSGRLEPLWLGAAGRVKLYENVGLRLNGLAIDKRRFKVPGVNRLQHER